MVQTGCMTVLRVSLACTGIISLFSNNIYEIINRASVSFSANKLVLFVRYIHSGKFVLRQSSTFREFPDKVMFCRWTKHSDALEIYCVTYFMLCRWTKHSDLHSEKLLKYIVWYIFSVNFGYKQFFTGFYPRDGFVGGRAFMNMVLLIMNQWLSLDVPVTLNRMLPT